MTSKIEESDSYAMLCLSLSVFYFGWFMAPPCKSRKTDALSRMNLVHFGAPVLTAIQSSTIRAKHISSPQNATCEIRLVWFFTSLSKWCVFFISDCIDYSFSNMFAVGPNARVSKGQWHSAHRLIRAYVVSKNRRLKIVTTYINSKYHKIKEYICF